MVNDNFHRFPRLPLELREEIWRLCLPHRVYEMDFPLEWLVYRVDEPEQDNVPCRLWATSKSNVRPPLITRVCRESRRVAFTTGKWVSSLEWRRAYSFDEPCEADWNFGNVIDRGHWEDTSRDSISLNWTPSYDVDWGPVNPEGHPLTSLAQEAKRLNGTASFMLDAMTDSWERHPDSSSWFLSTAPPANLPEGTPMTQREQNVAALKLLPEWLVVVKVVVIHLDIGRAADSGLFGLLGDEIIQVVDAALPLASQFYELAECCERGASALTIAQDFTRMSANDMDAMVNVKRTKISMIMR
ncbi:hypothetical protein KCU65_g5579, partial [Aureobasidium melanogenum]